MARIRTIKPEFWVSEQIGECSTNARLLFIGLWNFCDDQGIHPAKYRTLKAEVFPMDGCDISDIETWVLELLEAGLIQEYKVESKAYWIVTGWRKHQKIDRPSNRYPPPLDESSRALDEHSTNPRRILDEPHPPEGKGRESKGKDTTLPPTPLSGARVKVNGKKASTETLTQDVSKPILPEWIPEELWAEFVAMRKKIRAPITNYGQHLAIVKLERLRKAGEDPVEVIRQSIAYSYRGLFEVKGENGRHPGKAGSHEHGDSVGARWLAEERGES